MLDLQEKQSYIMAIVWFDSFLRIQPTIAGNGIIYSIAVSNASQEMTEPHNSMQVLVAWNLTEMDTDSWRMGPGKNVYTIQRKPS